MFFQGVNKNNFYLYLIIILSSHFKMSGWTGKRSKILSAWRRILHENLIFHHLIKEFPAIDEIGRFIQSKILISFLMSFLIIHSHLQIVLAIDDFLLVSPPKSSTHFSSLSYVPHVPSVLSWSIWSPEIYLARNTNQKSRYWAKNNNKTPVLYISILLTSKMTNLDNKCH